MQGRPGVHCGLTSRHMVPAGLLQVHPQRTKTNRQNPYAISIGAASEPVMDLYMWVTAVIATSAAIEQPIYSSMVRSSSPAAGQAGTRQCRFSEKPLSRGALYGRLVSLLTACRCYHGESLHSFRRGLAQFQRAQGHSTEQIMAQLLLQTRRILETVYLPLSRQQTGIRRARNAAALARPSRL